MADASSHDVKSKPSAKLSRPRRHVVGRLFLLLSISLVLTGCESNDEDIRQIQAQRQESLQRTTTQDHLGDVTQLLDQFMQLNREKASRQLTYHLNQWSRSANAGDSEKRALPEILSTLETLVPSPQFRQQLDRDEYSPADGNLLRDAYVFRKAVLWIDDPIRDDPLLDEWFKQLQDQWSEENLAKLRTASRLFDWTIRNVALEPDQVPLPNIEPAPQFPMGMIWEGTGYRQSDFQTLWRGRGDWQQRAGVFTQLCTQAGIISTVLATPSPEDGSLNPWCVGVLLDGELFLFEPRLGIHVPGPDQEGIATLSQARRDVTIMRRLDVAGFYDYPLSKTDVAQNVALLNVRPEMLSDRMRRLENGLTGDRRLTLFQDADAIARLLDDVSGIAGARLWEMPILSEVYAATCQGIAQRDPRFAFWLLSRWAILEGGDSASQNLSQARWAHLLGRMVDDEAEGTKGARSRYLQQRAPEFDIDDLSINIEIQKQYGLRRDLGMSQGDWNQQLQRIQVMMRLGKRTATYWLSLLQFDDGRFETAGNWFRKRVLSDSQQSIWQASANYNLARCLERSGQTDEAIEVLKAEASSSRHGNRIRARLLDKFRDAIARQAASPSSDS
ncbi:MAG: hypothetical protein AAGD07_20035 [Planctomycetota bacterium]